MKKPALLLYFGLLHIATAFAQLPAMVQDVSPGRNHTRPGGPCTWQGKMYFVASDTLHGAELWSYDETGPAQLELDFNPGKAPGISSMVVYGGKLIFAGNQGSGWELFSWDGSNPPTQITTLHPPAASGAPSELTVVGNTLYFAASHYRPNRPYPSNTRDLFSYNGVDTPKFYAPTPSSNFGLMPEWLIAYNNKLYFAGAVTNSGPIKKMHEVDPATGNIRILDAVIGSSDKFYHFFDPLVLGGTLYFTGFQYRHLPARGVDSTTVGWELHCLSGDSIRQLTHLAPSILFPGVSARIGPYNGAVYFGGADPDSAIQLYNYDPATDRVNRMCIISQTKVGSGKIGDLTEYNSKLYFVATTPATGYELWNFSDEVCGMVMDIFPGKGWGVFPDNASFHIYKGHLYFAATDSVHGWELWRIEGTTSIKATSWTGSVQAYPNPVINNTTLDIKLKETQDLQVALIDVQGRIIFEKKGRYAAGRQKLELPMQSWPSGTYFYRLLDGNGRRLASGSLVKQ